MTPVDDEQEQPMGPRSGLMRLVDTSDQLDPTHRGYVLWLAELLLDWQRAYRPR